MKRTSSHPYGPRWGQTNKWGKPKCSSPSIASGGVKPKKKSNSQKDYR